MFTSKKVAPLFSFTTYNTKHVYLDRPTLGYVTYDALRAVPMFSNQTIITFKAPPGTSLDVPLPGPAINDVCVE